MGIYNSSPRKLIQLLRTSQTLEHANAPMSHREGNLERSIHNLCNDGLPTPLRGRAGGEREHLLTSGIPRIPLTKPVSWPKTHSGRQRIQTKKYKLHSTNTESLKVFEKCCKKVAIWGEVTHLGYYEPGFQMIHSDRKHCFGKYK